MLNRMTNFGCDSENGEYVLLEAGAEKVTDVPVPGTARQLPPDLLSLVMEFAAYGAAPGEATCPAARFACVCKHWYKVYQQVPFLTNELKRIGNWTIREISHNPHGQGRVETIVDSWVRPQGVRTPYWWTSSWAFEPRFPRWTGNPEVDSAGGPFGLRPGCFPPHLMISFERPVKLRAITLEARNRPRMIRLTSINGKQGRPRVLLLEIPPPNATDVPERGLSPVKIGSPSYMRLVAQELPQGSPPSQQAVERNSALPVVLQEPLLCEEGLHIEILKSHERGWVGINKLALFE